MCARQNNSVGRTPDGNQSVNFIKRHCAFESRNLLLFFSFLFFYLAIILFYIFFHFFHHSPFFLSFTCLFLFSVICFITIFDTFMQIKFAYYTFSWLG